MKKLVRESINEEQDYGDNYPKLHRDSQSDWPSEDNESYGWLQEFYHALQVIFNNEDDENVFKLVEIADEEISQYEKEGKTPEEAARLISGNEDLLKQWEEIVLNGQSQDDESEDFQDYTNDRDDIDLYPGNMGDEESAPR